MGCMIIAEVGQAHDGSLGVAHSYIDALADTGIDAVKFQTHIAEAESSLEEPFRVKFSYEDKTRYDYWKRMEFTYDQWVGLKEHCEVKGLEFISSPFSNAAVDILESLGVNRYKIGSGEVSNYLLLKKIALTNKPIILSSGLSTIEELAKNVEFLKPYNNKLSILQCTTSYPTDPSQWGLNVLLELKNKFKLPIGFSDHSGDIYAGLAAATLGAEILEFHVVFDKRTFGPDSRSSLTIEEVIRLVQGVKQIETSLNNKINKNDKSKLCVLKKIFGKSLAINRPLLKGDKIKFDFLETKKPLGVGIPSEKYNVIVGRKVSRDMKKWEFITEADLL
jgi:N,N'-diacetyllegionaminate synthase